MRHKILVIDDDQSFLEAIKQAFLSEKYEVMTARSGRDGLQQALAFHPDIVILDIMMPEMDGYEAIHEIRKDSRFTSTPVIALTAKAMKEDRQKCLDAGASDYISKPIDITKLLSLLRIWLKK